jgi:hypothetical protein
MKPILIDNCLPQLFFNDIVSRVTDWGKVPYVFVPNTAYPRPEINDPLDYSFCHMVFDRGNILSSLHDTLNGALLIMLDSAKISFTRLIRIRVGLITAMDINKRHDPHTDMPARHKTALLYLNTVDGDTTLYNEFHDPNSATKIDKWTVQHSIKPEANRALIFDGFQYHSSSTPTTNPYRLIVNYNFT